MHLQSSKRFSVLLTLSLGVGEAPKRLSMPLWMTLLEVDTDLDLLLWLARERLDRLPPLLPRLSKSSRCHNQRCKQPPKHVLLAVSSSDLCTDHMVSTKVRHGEL